MPPSEPLLPVQGRSRARNLLPPILLLGMLGLVAVCLLLGADFRSSAEVSLAVAQADGVDLSKDNLQDKTVHLTVPAGNQLVPQQGLATKKASTSRGTNWGTISVGGYVKADVALLKLQDEMLREGFPGAYKRAKRETLKGKSASELKASGAGKTVALAEKAGKKGANKDKKDDQGGCGCCGNAKCGCCGGYVADASIHNTGYYLAGNKLSGNSNVIIYGTKATVSHSGGGVANAGGAGGGAGGAGGGEKAKGGKKK